jgi:alpha-amylase
MRLRAAVGTTANAYTPTDDGWALAAEGYHWRYFLPTSAETVFPSLPSGEYHNAPTVTLRAISVDKNAQIVYTLDGSNPTASGTKVANGTKVTLPNGKCTLKAALLANGKVGTIVTRTYDVRKFEAYTFAVYVNTENVGWKNCYFWTWGGDDTHAPANKKWPGDNVTTLTEKNGKKWYSKQFKINTPTDYVNFVFAKESSVQTADVSGITTDAYFEIQNSKDSQGHYLVKNVTADQPTAIADITVSHNANATSVVAIDGRTVRHFNSAVSTTEAIDGLAPGIYIVNGKKVLVR